ncbi:MAG: 16S rRNA (guanine(527)-N(7))-methyltransferase RsmG [Hyphomonadaceae bacterium]
MSFPDQDEDGTGPDEVRTATGVSRETMARVSAFLDVLDSWRTRINLIGPGEGPRIWRRHVLDSLQLAPVIPSAALTLADLGTGSGFPGIILACAMAERPGARVWLVEKSVRKAEFLQAAVEALNLPATVVQARAEEAESERCDVVTARALAPLPKLLELAAAWADSNSCLLFLKGKDATDELQAARAGWAFDLSIQPSLSSPEGRVLSITSLRRRTP